MKTLLRWGFLGVYGAFVAVAVGYYEYYIHFDRGNSEFSGLPIVVLGLPWSLAIPQIAGTGSSLVNWLPLIGGIIINGAILRLFGEVISRNLPRTPSQ